MKILFVEDDQLNREAIAQYLELEGYEICTLSEGSNFLPTLATFQPDLILLDLKLPDIDGLTLMEALQYSPWARIPVVILSAYGFSREQRRAKQLGVRRFLVKPTLLEELRKAIENELIA